MDHLSLFRIDLMKIARRFIDYIVTTFPDRFAICAAVQVARWGNYC